MKPMRKGDLIMKKEISIEGMSCGHCSGRVEKALNELEGVTVEVVSHDDNNAIVEVAETVTDDKLKETVEDAGYDVIEIK